MRDKIVTSMWSTFVNSFKMFSHAEELINNPSTIEIFIAVAINACYIGKQPRFHSHFQIGKSRQGWHKKSRARNQLIKYRNLGKNCYLKTIWIKGLFLLTLNKPTLLVIVLVLTFSYIKHSLFSTEKVFPIPTDKQLFVQ